MIQEYQHIHQLVGQHHADVDRIEQCQCQRQHDGHGQQCGLGDQAKHGQHIFKRDPNSQRQRRVQFAVWQIHQAHWCSAQPQHCRAKLYRDQQFGLGHQQWRRQLARHAGQSVGLLRFGQQH